jgi:UDP-glucose 4-epimerase
MAGGYDVVIIDDLSKGRYIWQSAAAKPELVKNTILDCDSVRSTIRSFQPEFVFHLAAHHYIPFCEKNPFDAFHVNVTGTLNVLDAAYKAGSVKKFFVASTGDVYAPCAYPHSEIDATSPVYVYGETKLLCEAMLRRYKSSVRVPFDIVIGRLFNAAGSRETNPHLLPEVCRQLDAGFDVIEVGNTWPVRDFVDVGSMAKVIISLTERGRGIDVFNIGSGNTLTVQEALDLLVQVHGHDVKILPVDSRKRVNDRPYLCPSVEKLRNFLGFTADSFSVKTAKTIWEEPLQTRRLYT